MKKIFIALVTVILLLLDWAALHDIMKGEQSPVAEYVTLAGSVVIIVVMLSYAIKQKHRKESEK